MKKINKIYGKEFIVFFQITAASYCAVLLFALAMLLAMLEAWKHSLYSFVFGSASAVYSLFLFKDNKAFFSIVEKSESNESISSEKEKEQNNKQTVAGEDFIV